MLQASPDRIAHDLDVLVRDIGVRLAGTPGERAAADHVLANARALGADAWDESFPMRARVVTEEQLEIDIDGTWRPFPCSLFSSTPGTDGEWRSAELTTLTPTDYQRDDLGHLCGKAVIHMGCHIESRASYQRLMDAGPAFLLMVDTRYPADTPRADGMFPEYTAAIGAVPTLNVAHHDAWTWTAVRATRARCRVVGGMVPATSQNVVIDLPGTDLADDILYASAHHDTQANSPGADDNGSGVVGVMELARLLQPQPRRRTIRLISFGAEEQLSVGSAAYVRTHRDEVSRRGRCMYNLDSYGSHLGWTQLYINAHPDFEASLRPYFRTADLYYQTITAVVPYADHFPFVAAGMPGVFHYRVNCDGGRFFHHRPDDDLTRVSPEVIARDVSAVANWLEAMAESDTLPFTPAIPEAQRHDVERCWEDLFGGWK
ncbi:Arginyl aminopeptidase [Luteitalea pratensis]|uniref:Arginyl aminopeptidase n=1 Tax=Luteitalea pratensis TaxID=1855912 RepID=A0A143PJM8_LUTPR|nr:M28 family peptidase [Luteitalea pratensis]AMY07984.1 Arginyl aminopeptidase [Luteitalea pratensis]